MTNRAALALVFFLAFALLSACGTAPDLPNGGVSCGVGGLCPDGFACAADGFCYNDGSGPEFDAAPDNCGNGTIEVGETCDPIELCPESCDDGNACTNDVTLGAAETCNLSCLHDLISACQNGDGCCPDGCDSDSDDDCSATCGNGEVDDGETCDPPASCPATCSDGNACTVDERIGSPANCNVTCTFTNIRDCESGDGCCPAGCNANSDSDCSATCGNGTREPGETCDPPASCPTSCSDGNSCTIDNRVGSAANCNVSCTFTPIAQCKDDDGCCASGCNANSDNDCSATCGNGTIETGETCDPPGSCPATCDDDNACTIDNRTGQASQCNVVCSSTTIVSCANNDGCCPAGCDANDDNDCSVTCGNGSVEDGETCDPPEFPCPSATECATGDPCRPGFLTGSADQCNAECAVSEINECKDGDECCPVQCIGDDSDCGSSTCGDGFCDEVEKETCPVDCGTGECGDGFCTEDEIDTCPDDCDFCGDGFCSEIEKETCPLDCGFCGDGFCAPDEVGECFDDCGNPPECGNRECEPGEQLPGGPFECPEDCQPKCGDAVCEPGEFPGGPFECPEDCPEPECGNRECEPGERSGEPFECPDDCPDPKCGDEVCEPGELPGGPFECPDDCPAPECGNRECEPGEGPGGPFECPDDCETVPPPLFSVAELDGLVCLPTALLR